MRAAAMAVVMGNDGVSYLLRDDFADTVPAGSVNGTPAVPGPGARTVVDANSNASIAGGNLIYGGTNWWGDPGVWYGGVSRTPGRVALFKVSSLNGISRLGFDADQSGATDSPAFNLDTAATDAIVSGSLVRILSSRPSKIAVALRANGAQFFVEDGGGWGLHYIESVSSEAILYPVVASHATILTSLSVDYVRIPDEVFLASPVASDGAFGVSTDGAGHAETSGVGAGGNGLPWADNKGTWSGGSASSLSGGEAIRTVDVSHSDLFVDLDITRTGGNASIMLRYTDDDNYLRCGTDGTNAVLTEKVGGAENELLSTGITYSAGATMRIRLEGQDARVYYNGPFVNSATVNAALTGTRVGLYSTDTTNTFDNMVVYKSTGHTHLD